MPKAQREKIKDKEVMSERVKGGFMDFEKLNLNRYKQIAVSDLPKDTALPFNLRIPRS